MNITDKENKYYSKHKNWDFPQIKYSTIFDEKNEFEFYNIIEK